MFDGLTRVLQRIFEKQEVPFNDFPCFSCLYLMRVFNRLGVHIYDYWLVIFVIKGFQNHADSALVQDPGSVLSS